MGLIYYSINKDDRIYLGVLGDYSNSEFTASVDSFRAVELAIQEIDPNQNKYVLKRYDFSQLEEGTKLKDKLEHDEINIVIGPTTSSHFYRLEEELNTLDLPIFLITVSAHEAHGTKDKFFGLTDDILNNSKCMASFMNDGKANSTIIFYSEQNIEFSKSYSEQLAKDLIHENNNENIQLVQIGDIGHDQTQNILQKKLDVDRVVIIGPPGYAGIAGSFIAEQNKFPIYFSGWAKSERTLEYLEGVDNDLYFISQPPTNNGDFYNVLKNKITIEQKANMNNFAISGYETIYFMDWVLSQSKSTSIDDLSHVIHELDMYEGKINTFEFNDYGDGSRGYALYKEIDDTFVYYAECDQ